MEKKQHDRLKDQGPGCVIYSGYAELFKDIPVEGSLGLLALGATGVRAWRRKREAVLAERASAEPEEGNG